ncbi:MAG TPA: acetate--CoA ligase family protein [bacterium]|jgi:acyl-CoA synthetase (NDP forming)
MHPDFDRAVSILKNAADSGRFTLYEFEIYDVMTALGIGNPPKYAVITNPDDAEAAIEKIPGNLLVLKIVHPRIAHKSDIGGIAIVEREEAASTAREILEILPKKVSSKFIDEDFKNEFTGFSREQLREKFVQETRGVLVCEFIESDLGFGNEFFIGMRDTREFGPVINAGLGGLDTELYARELPMGRSGSTVAVGVSNDADLLNTFKHTIAFETLTGLARGHKRLVDEDTLSEIFALFHAITWKLSPLNPDAEYWLTEFEINPLLIKNGALVPIDGLMKFVPTNQHPPRKPTEKIANLLNPDEIALIGVSSKGQNVGRVILGNLLEGDFSPDTLAIVKEDDDEIDGVKCYPSVSALPKKFDLIVLSVAAKKVPSVLREIIDHDKAQSIILITGGMGEKEGSEGIEEELRQILTESRSRKDHGPVMVGGNSLGLISQPGGYDTMFIPESKLPKHPEIEIGNRIALISQSGAFMISRMSKLGGLLPRCAISTGNQVDLGVSDFLEYLSNDPKIKVFGCYIEGFDKYEGLNFAEVAKTITDRGKDVVVYKAGRSPEGRRAASGHTAAIAGDWVVAESVLTQAGCFVTRSFGEWTDYLELAAGLAGTRPGQGRLAAVSNAGYETVDVADNIHAAVYEQERDLHLTSFTDETIEKIKVALKKFRLDGLVNVRNPLDLTPMAVDAAHIEILKILNDDENVDVIIHGCVPLSPAMKTLPPGGSEGEGIEDPRSYASLLVEAYRKDITKPLVVVIDSGSLYDPMSKKISDSGIPVFRSADNAVKTLGWWIATKKIAFARQLHPIGLI